MYIANHKFKSDEVVVMDSDWYIKIRMELYDKRHNNEFLIFKRKDIKNHLFNLKNGWNRATTELKNWLENVSIKFDQIEVNDDFLYLSEYLGEQEEIQFKYEDGLKVQLNLDSITFSDYQIYKGIEDLFETYEFTYFDDVIQLYYERDHRQYGSFILSNFFDFSNFVKKIEEFSEFAEKSMHLVSEIKKNEVLFFKQYTNYSNDIKYLYFHEYKSFDDKIMPFNKVKRKVKVSNEHGSTKY